MSIPETSARALAEGHAGVLLDAYGVLVDSERALPGAAEFIRHLHRGRTPFLVLTNDASKHPERGAARYRAFGLDLTPEHIVTSGSLLAGHFAALQLEGAATMVLGTEDSERYARDAGGEVLPLDAPDAEVFVVCDEAGYDLLEGIDHVMSVILARLQRGARCHLVLPNPDLIYPKRSGEFGIAAGSIAAMIESAIALRFPDRPPERFARLGKPFPSIFEAAVQRLGTNDLVMIGDQLATDIRGARQFGLSAGLVTWGLTDRIPNDLPAHLRPTHRVTSF